MSALSLSNELINELQLQLGALAYMTSFHLYKMKALTHAHNNCSVMSIELIN